ncbi:LLM class flavin-dependent oxidoreductase [Phototrophicus methaneseepsis]|uniref:LLM class flavin-dependent oxidoreductase n=1 Tax=Phototrophicus methaneseepsis TaxID=2710758 RepID=A0A7S8E6X8_9CHLR|nr:LLM class flavin-dependent oxidoreductase [Phototrophicus methaneseepsis]QPC81428.1 LLM class flavin-dependent oxidoreductase [Phototrophicus methaneseepsis]
MKFSLRLNNDLPVQTYVRLAQQAEKAEFDQFWVSDDLFLRSAPVILSAVAVATTKIEIGSCILNPYTLNPGEMAMIAATLDELSGGRFNLGLSSGSADFLKWVGIDQKLPRTAVLETIDVFKRLMRGERAPLDGRALKWTEEAYLRFEPLREIPIYIGATSPKMVTEIGRHADGGLPLLLPPEHISNVMPYIQQGAQEAGRDMDEIDAAACIWVSISDDQAAAEDVLKEKIAYYGHAFSETILAQIGLTPDDFIDIDRAVAQENDIEKGKSLVTDQMLQIGIAGTAKSIIPRLEHLADLGAKHISFGPPLGPDLEAALDELSREVLPYFR